MRNNTEVLDPYITKYKKYKLNSLLNSNTYGSVYLNHIGPITWNNSRSKNNKINHHHHNLKDKNKNTFRKISHQDFHNTIRNDNYYNNSLQNNNFRSNEDYFNEKKIVNRYEKSSSLEKDLDIMKIKMSFDLLTFKINKIKNKIQDLH